MYFSGSPQINNPLVPNFRITTRRPGKVISKAGIATCNPRRVIENTVRRRAAVHYCWAVGFLVRFTAGRIHPLLSASHERCKAK